MARRPEPWYWKSRKAWYVQVDGKQIKLGDDPGPRPRAGPKAPPEVMRAYHRLMADAGLLTEAERKRATVPDVCDAFLAVKAKLSRSTYRNYVLFLSRLAAPNMKKAFSSLRAGDVERVARGETTWGETTRRDFVGHAITLFKWAKEAGYVESNALAGYFNPYHAAPRERLLTDEEFAAILGMATDLQFRQIMMFMRGTGCRPGEARIVTAGHVHAIRPLVTLKPKEHKTGHRTGKARVLLMPADVETMVRALAKQHPEGPIFRNSRNGRGWGHSALSKRFRDYREKLGLGDDVVPYLVRHAAATRWLEDGTDVVLVARMMGHSGTNTLQSTYFHPDVDRMIDAADRTHAFRKGDGKTAG